MHIYEITTPADVALAGGVAKTVLAWITGATRRARCIGIRLAAKSVTQADVPMLVELVRFAGADGTGTAATPVAVDSANPAAIGTAKYNYTVEPVTPTVVWTNELSPIGVTLIEQIPPQREYTMPISTEMGLRLTSPQAQNVRCTLTFEE